MQIKGYNLNDELIVEIGKFAVLWNLFEKIHCDNKCNNRKILEDCSYLYVSSEKQNRLAVALNRRREWFEQLHTEFISKGLFSDDRQANEDEIKQIEAFLKQDGNTLYGCLLCVFRIRNNMMHGLKDVETLNTQVEIFKSVNDILESV